MACSTIITLLTHLRLLAFVYLRIAVSLRRNAILDGNFGNHGVRRIFSTKVTLDRVLILSSLPIQLDLYTISFST